MARSVAASASWNPKAVVASTGSLPAARTDRARRSCQMRSWARMAIRRPTSVQDLGEVMEDVAGRDDTGGAPILDDRDVPEPTDGHLVDGDRDRVVVAQDDGIPSHEVADPERLQWLAGGSQHRIAVGEDPDQAVVHGDEHAIRGGLLHAGDRHVD